MTDLVYQIENGVEGTGAKGRVARILTNGGLLRVVCETPAEPLEFQIEQVKFEMNEEYPDAEFEVTITEE
jgi:hypothetical protein